MVAEEGSQYELYLHEEVEFVIPLKQKFLPTSLFSGDIWT